MCCQFNGEIILIDVSLIICLEVDSQRNHQRKIPNVAPLNGSVALSNCLNLIAAIVARRHQRHL